MLVTLRTLLLVQLVPLALMALVVLLAERPETERAQRSQDLRLNHAQENVSHAQAHGWFGARVKDVLPQIRSRVQVEVLGSSCELSRE